MPHNLKMTDDHFAHLKGAIEAALEAPPGPDAVVKKYEVGAFPRADRVNDLQRRFCFDLLWQAGLTNWVCDELYPYLDDDHLYSALRKICPVVVRRY